MRKSSFPFTSIVYGIISVTEINVKKIHSFVSYNQGFGGKFGVECDRVDKSAHTFNDQEEKVGTVYEKEKPQVSSVKQSVLRAKFENLAKESEEESKKQKEEEQERRRQRDSREKKEAREREEARLRFLREKEGEEQRKLNEGQSPKMEAENAPKESKINVNSIPPPFLRVFSIFYFHFIFPYHFLE